MQHELFSPLQPRPDDPILGLNELFQKDERPEKVNLTVGAYLTDAGVMPLLPTVEEAARCVLARREPHAYIPMSGLPAYNESVRRLLFGAERAPALSERTATVQTIGGTGALYLAALFAKKRFRRKTRRRVGPDLGQPHRDLQARGARGRHLPLLQPHARRPSL